MSDTVFETVIGLEVHCQLRTESKLFCSCASGKNAVNQNTCPTCAGHPGTLPVLNRKAVELAVKAGLALGCDINQASVFSRKNYFYPDLPKGYQISQYDQPICLNGKVAIEIKGEIMGEMKEISLERIHMEEDAGKNTHMGGFSLVDLNRASVPLIEIVSKPEMRSAAEAGAYLRSLHSILTFAGVSDANMEDGQFRCDANVSVRPLGSSIMMTRTEIKNVNSFRFVERAIEYEASRQIEVVKSGGSVVQETRSFDSSRGTTQTMRVKEEAADYRYFPDPDLVPIVITNSEIIKIKESLPELPSQRILRYRNELRLSAYDASVLISSKFFSDFFDDTIELCLKQGLGPEKSGKLAANLLTGEVLRMMNDEAVEVDSMKLQPSHLASCVAFSINSEVSSTNLKLALQKAWKTGDSLESIVERDGLKQVSDDKALEPLIDEILEKFPSQVNDYRSGKEKILGFLVGQIMKASGGKANPGLLKNLVKKKLKSD